MSTAAKLFGVVPARMAASRFPGKPLTPILGMPMVEHVFRRAELFRGWQALTIATCDEEINRFAINAGFSCVQTSNKHTRALDRVAEAAASFGDQVSERDIVINVQGDEPMLRPDMFNLIEATFTEANVDVAFLAMDIVDECQYYDPNILKVVHDLSNNAIYTSRAPIPYTKTFSQDLGAKRIFGLFAFRWHALKNFTGLAESPLESAEACDINRLFDHGYKVKIVGYPSVNAFSVDSREDLDKVEKFMLTDPLFGKY